MAKNPNNIAKLRRLRGLSQQQLAEKLGAHPVTLSNLERGQAPLTAEWTERISMALQVDEAALLTIERPLRVFVGGEISATATVLWETEDWREDDKFAVAIASTTPVISAADIPRWVLVRDESLYPVFRRHDVVRLVIILEDRPEELAWAMQRLCVVNHSYVGYLEKGTTADTVSVMRIGGPPVTNIRPTSIFVIDRAIFQPDFPPR